MFITIKQTDKSKDYYLKKLEVVVHEKINFTHLNYQ